MTSPLISVIMPVYNAEAYVAKAIESILSQTFKDFEFIILNDGSTDNSTDIIKSYANKDDRIRYLEQDNQGQTRAFNRLLEEAKCPLSARMDADDIAEPDRLEKQYDYMQNNPDVAVLGGAIKTFDQVVKYPKYDEIVRPKHPILSSPVAHPTVLYRTDIIKACGGYRNYYNRYASEDYDLWLRVLEKGHKIDNIDDVILFYRLNDETPSIKNIEFSAMGTTMALASALMRQNGHADPTDDFPDIGIGSLEYVDELPLSDNEKSLLWYNLSLMIAHTFNDVSDNKAFLFAERKIKLSKTMKYNTVKSKYHLTKAVTAKSSGYYITMIKELMVSFVVSPLYTFKKVVL